MSQYKDEKGNERDALGIGSETWVTELKWKKSAAGEREMNKLIASAHRLAADKAWFVSQNGFTAEAVELAAQNGVLVTDGDGFAEIRRLVWK